MTNRIAFIDTRVENYQSLIDGLAIGTEVIILNDNIFGWEGSDVLNGDDGNDYIEGGEDNDTISGGTGSDTIYGDIGDDTLNGDDGADHLYGGVGSDTINGGDGNDELSDFRGFWETGPQDINYLDGGNGQDYFSYYSGIAGDYAFVKGGADSDTYYLDPSSKGKLVATDFEVGAGGDILSVWNLLYNNVTNTYGNSQDYLRLYQRGIGASAETWLQWDATGTAGNGSWQDVIQLKNGVAAIVPTSLTYENFSNWQLPPVVLNSSAPVVSNPISQPVGGFLGATFEFTIPADTFFDPDADLLDYSAILDDGTQTGVNLDETYDRVAGTIKISGTVPATLDAGLHNIKIIATDPSGNSVSTTLLFLALDPSNADLNGDNFFNGTSGDDIWVGLGGSDFILGNDGNDILVGDGTGSDLSYDIIYGGWGNDTLVAGDGGALLFGEQGNDTLLGGAGPDQLSGGPGSDHIVAGAGNDYIEEIDNAPGDADIIDGKAGDDIIKYVSDHGLGLVTGGAGSDILGQTACRHILQTNQGLPVPAPVIARVLIGLQKGIVADLRQSQVIGGKRITRWVAAKIAAHYLVNLQHVAIGAGLEVGGNQFAIRPGGQPIHVFAFAASYGGAAA